MGIDQPIPPIPPPPAPPQPIPTPSNAPVVSPDDTQHRTLITVLLLLFVYPIGVITMWVWSKWKTWIKAIVSLPLLLGLVILLLVVIGVPIFVLTHPGKVTVTTKQTTTQGGANGTSCVIDSDCQSNKCVTTPNGRICSEGNVGDACFMSSDCQLKHCVKDVCISGKIGDPCFISLDCQEGLTCAADTCQEKSVLTPSLPPTLP